MASMKMITMMASKQNTSKTVSTRASKEDPVEIARPPVVVYYTKAEYQTRYDVFRMKKPLHAGGCLQWLVHSPQPCWFSTTIQKMSSQMEQNTLFLRKQMLDDKKQFGLMKKFIPTHADSADALAGDL